MPVEIFMPRAGLLDAVRDRMADRANYMIESQLVLRKDSAISTVSALTLYGMECLAMLGLGHTMDGDAPRGLATLRQESIKEADDSWQAVLVVKTAGQRLLALEKIQGVPNSETDGAYSYELSPGMIILHTRATPLRISQHPALPPPEQWAERAKAARCKSLRHYLSEYMMVVSPYPMGRGTKPKYSTIQQKIEEVIFDDLERL